MAIERLKERWCWDYISIESGELRHIHLYCRVEETWSKLVKFGTYVFFRNSPFFHLRFGKVVVVHSREGILLPHDSLVDHDRTVISVDTPVLVVVAPTGSVVSNLGHYFSGHTHGEVQYQQMAADAHCMVGDVVSLAIQVDPCLGYYLGRSASITLVDSLVLYFAQGMDLRVEVNHYKRVASSTYHLKYFFVCMKHRFRHLLPITYTVG